MQAKNLDGSYGKPEPFNQDKMEEQLKYEKVEHVEIFESRDKEFKRRMALHNRPQVVRLRRKKNKQSRKSRKRLGR